MLPPATHRPITPLRTLCIPALACLCLCLGVSGVRGVWAAPTTAAQARQVVENWRALEAQPMQSGLPGVVRSVDAFSGPDGETDYYMVGMQPDGFVVVAADDLVEPIVAFAPTGTYNASMAHPMGALVTNDMAARAGQARQAELRTRASATPPPPAMSTARNKWRALEAGRSPVQARRADGQSASISDVRVSPLLSSAWSQSTVAGLTVYNHYTPNSYVSGCVATAMSQLMRFWSFPTAEIGVHAKSIFVDGNPQSNNTRGGDGAGGAYAWGSMPLVPDGTVTLAQRRAIGNLVYDAGLSVGMDYTSSGSGSDTLQSASALVSLFGYSNAKTGYNAGADMPATNRNHMVNPNLDAGYPVLFGITGTPGGHAIVGDGYGYNSATLYHHLNMGWAGSQDAWYNLPNIDASGSPFTSVYKVIYNVYTTGSGEIISGRILDTSGNPVSGATVTATKNGGGTSTATTDAKGIYALPKIASASTYTITATKSGTTYGSITVSTGTSTNTSTTTGNKWAQDIGGGVSPSASVPALGPISWAALCLALALAGLRAARPL